MTRQGATRKATKEKGVYELVSETKFAKSSRGKTIPDVCYYIAYKLEGKLIWEKIGWISEGYSIIAAAHVRGERLRTIRHGEELPQQKAKAPTFKTAMENYLAWADTNKANGRTTDNYLYQGHKGETGHLKHLDDRRLDEIKPNELEKLKEEILGKGLAPATAKHILVLVGEVYNKAITWGDYKGENPVKKVKMPVLQNKRERFLSHEEANTLLSALKKKSPQLHDICLLSLYCGLRAGEILNIRGQDLDFENSLIHIADPKNKHPRKAYMTTRIKEMLLTRKPKSPGDLIFKSRKDKKISSISRTFERVVDDLKLNEGITDPRQKLVAHSLRHTFASWLALQGESIQVIGELLGHRTLTMTQRYAHLTGDHKRRAAERLEAAFSGSHNGKAINIQDSAST